MTDPRWPYRPLLDLIGKAEGTDAPKGRGYNETLAYGAYTGGPVNLVGMTLGEIDALQTRMLRHPANKWNSSAIGRYQIVRTTLRAIKKRLKLSDGELFDEAMQDRLGCFLLGTRGVDRMLAGTMSESAFINALAREWASFPKTNGKGHYSGQGTGVTLPQVRAAIDAVRERASQPAPAPAPAPITPNTEEISAMLKRLFRDPRAYGAVSLIAAAFGLELSTDQVSTIATAAAERSEQLAIGIGGVAWLVQRWRALRAG